MEVVDFPNYLIYKNGNLFNKKTKKLLKPWLCSNGYYYYTLRNNPKQSNKTMHSLIGKYYIPNPNNYPMIDHIDRNKLNNNISNLRWCNYITNNNNMGVFITNKLKHKNICKDGKYFIYQKYYKNKRYKKIFKTLSDALTYKFIMILKYKNFN